MYDILLVDDDRVVRYHLKKMNLWKEYGFTISNEAVDGYEALEKISSFHFDIAFVDIKMPRIDGIEFLKELRENRNDMCAIFLSGFSDFAYARQGIVLGAFDYILKPVDEKSLCDVLLRVKLYLDNKNKEWTLHEKLSGLVDKSMNISSLNQEMAKVIKKLHLDHEDSVVKRLCEYVIQHCDEKISLESASVELGFSSSHLGRLFRQKTGEGFIEYVTKVKMERGKALLNIGKYKNYEISDILCYSQVDYFSCLFKKYTGVTPTDYRQSTHSQRECE